MKFLNFILNKFHKKNTEQAAAPAPVSSPLDYEIDAVYKVLVDVMGTENLVLKAGKLQALPLLRSENRGERILALQRILNEDPLLGPAPKDAEIPAALEQLKEHAAQLIARRNVADSIEKRSTKSSKKIIRNMSMIFVSR